MIRLLVVLPAPLTPRKAVTRPGSAVAVKPSRTVTGPYCLLSWWNERVGMSVSSCGRAGLADTNDPARQGSGASAQRPNRPAPVVGCGARQAHGIRPEAYA